MKRYDEDHADAVIEQNVENMTITSGW